MIGHFVPTRFEIPLGFSEKAEVFGMGARAAEKLAEKLNRSEYSKIIVFGCAGALRTGMKSGETFVVKSVTDGESHFEIPTKHSQSISLFTSRKIVSDQNEKVSIHSKTKAELVDMEMFFLWKNLSDTQREKVIFVRGIIDEFDDSLLALAHLHRLPLKWWRYQKEMKKFLKELA